MTKVIANYLPQYHRIPENDKWWGEGYTDWEAVKKSKPLYDGHQQPRIPLNDHYYSLDDVDEIRWQAELARKNKIYGFGIYHYWFNSHMCLLDKPSKILLEAKDIDINFMFIWDNASWKRTWSNVKFGNDWAPGFENDNTNENGMLAELIYGGEKEWKEHFQFLLPFFKDKRYIKINNRPVFSIYNQNNDNDTLKLMINHWNVLAKREGFDGVYILGKHNNKGINICDTEFYYEPEWSGWMWQNQIERLKNKFIDFARKKFFKGPYKYNYDQIWKKIIKNAKKNKDKNVFCGSFVMYDDTPRRGVNGKIVTECNPLKFEKYFEELYKISNDSQKEFVFVTAWNEWGEGAYLEPDSINEYSYIHAIRNVVGKYEKTN